MKATVLIDNTAQGELLSEWGLAIYIEHEGSRILLDTGKSAEFTKNAQALNINLSDIDFGVLSHAHYDHSDGMDEFFKENSKADFYLRQSAGENCYHKQIIYGRYIGIRKGILKKYKDRITYVDGDYKLTDGVYLIPHKTSGLENIGRKAKMYVKKGLWLKADNFSHEQSLVIETEKGLVIFNSCSHGGADNIVREIRETFPGKRIYAIIGGFHLFRSKDDEIHAFAKRVKETGIEHVITGHCTGEHAAEILIGELGDKVEIMHSGMVIEI